MAEVLNDLEEIYSQEVIDAKRGVEISLPPLPVGRYVVVPQYRDAKTGEMRMPDVYDYDSDIRVTDLDVWTVKMHKRGEFRAYVVDAATSGPVEGAVVHVEDRDGEKKFRNRPTNLATWCLTRRFINEAILFASMRRMAMTARIPEVFISILTGRILGCGMRKCSPTGEFIARAKR